MSPLILYVVGQFIHCLLYAVVLGRLFSSFGFNLRKSWGSSANGRNSNWLPHCLAKGQMMPTLLLPSAQFGLLSTPSHQTVELSVLTEDVMQTTCDKRTPRTGVHAFSMMCKQILNTFCYNESDHDSTDCAMCCRRHVSRCSLHADLVE